MPEDMESKEASLSTSEISSERNRIKESLRVISPEGVEAVNQTLKEISDSFTPTPGMLKFRHIYLETGSLDAAKKEFSDAYWQDLKHNTKFISWLAMEVNADNEIVYLTSTTFLNQSLKKELAKNDSADMSLIFKIRKEIRDETKRIFKNKPAMVSQDQERMIREQIATKYVNKK